MSASPESPRATWLRLKAETVTGKFVPQDWNWAVDVNAIPVPDESVPDGWSYQKRVCIYIMGDGSQQCLYDFPLIGEPSPEKWETAEKMIRETFGINRILRGVG